MLICIINTNYNMILDIQNALGGVTRNACLGGVSRQGGSHSADPPPPPFRNVRGGARQLENLLIKHTREIQIRVGG